MVYRHPNKNVFITKENLFLLYNCDKHDNLSKKVKQKINKFYNNTQVSHFSLINIHFG